MSEEAFTFDGRSPGQGWERAGNGFEPRVELTGEDREAMDALIEAAFDVQGVSVLLRARAERVAAVFGLLGCAVGGARGQSAGTAPDALVDLTLARIQRQIAAARSESPAVLSPNDEDAFEALVGNGYEPAGVASVLRKRATHQRELLALLEPTRSDLAQNIAEREGRVGRTLVVVQSSVDGRENRFKLETARSSRFRLADLVTVAALLLIASAAIGPMLGAMRDQARKASCQAGLLGASQGLVSYVSDHKDELPMASASLAGNLWWNVGVPELSNSANLHQIISTGYTTMSDLACAGNPTACRQDRGQGAADWRTLDEVSYSYQNMFSKVRPTWHDQARFVVIVDASPVVRRAKERRLINPLANSMNHAGKGQNAIFSDGSVEWLNSPVLKSGDNIWLPRSLEQIISKLRQPTQAEPINGVEMPEAKDDAFVVP